MIAFFFPRSWRSRVLLAVLTLLALGFFLQAFWLEPDSLIVAEYRISPPSWPAVLDGFKIAAVGDIHGGAPFVDREKIEAMVRRVSQTNPDLIVWLGDYVIQGVVGGTFMAPEDVASILSTARARNGQVAIIGNHDRWLNPARVEHAFEKAGIPFLRWRDQSLKVNGVTLHLYGLDDFELSPNYWPHFETTKELWSGIPAGEPIIALSHNPDVFPWIPARVTLTLASHTHGGQVRLPFLGSLIVPSSFGQRFARGHVIEGGRHLFVNTGLGTSIVPMRWHVPPEISVLILSSQTSH